MGRSWGDHRPLLPAGLHWTPRCREGLPFAAATSGCRSSKSPRSSCSNGIGPKAIRSPKGVRMRLQDDIGDSEILLKIDRECMEHDVFWGVQTISHIFLGAPICEYIWIFKNPGSKLMKPSKWGRFDQTSHSPCRNCAVIIDCLRAKNVDLSWRGACCKASRVCGA